MTHSGGIVGSANLVLLGDVQIPFNSGNWLFSLKGGLNKQTGVTENITYVTIGCEGVEEMGLRGEIQFSKQLFLPIKPDGSIDDTVRKVIGVDGKERQIPNRVRGELNVVATDWNNMMVDISLSPFVLAKHPKKFTFSINQATFDFSDYHSPDARFPDFYYENNLLQPSPELWRGVYVKSLNVGLPPEFKSKESIKNNKRINLSAVDMFIDNFGVSGKFAADNLIQIDEGRTSSSKAWQFSVNHLGVELQANQLVSAKFDGEVLLPISKAVSESSTQKQDSTKVKRNGLGYSGFISEEEYLLSVSTLNDISFDIWKAKAVLQKNSSVELLAVDGNFKPKAILNGTMSISAASDDDQSSSEDENSNQVTTGSTDKQKLAEFKGIKFQNLVLQTEAPVFQADYFGYQGEVKLANFPVSIADINLTANNSEASLGFQLRVNLMGEKDKGFSGATRLKIVGSIEEKDYKQTWQYKELDLSQIEIKANVGSVKLEGFLDLMRNHPEYGNGFSAEVQGTFGKVGPITTKAIFGRKDFRYWYVDAAVEGLKLNVGGALQISGFSGGASYRMKRRPNLSVAKFSPSGLSYVPDLNTRLGVKAMVMGGVMDESTVSFGAGFEISFNKNYGIENLGFFGETQIMKAIEFANPATGMQQQLEGMVQSESLNKAMDSKVGEAFIDKAKTEYPESSSTEASIEGYIGMLYDFRNDVFNADLEMYVNTAGGLVQGRGAGGQAGWGVVHISKEEWFAHLGTPSNRIGLRLGVGPLSIETGAYFMVGDRLEPSPPPPPEVADILGTSVNELDYMRDENSLSAGKGVAFGTSFKMDTGDLRFLMFYARFMAGTGFDIMLRDYGQASCSNTGKQIGIDGWYANGQAYAYLQGELGINVKLFFVKKKIPIIEAGAAVLLQAKAPNPIWIKGYLGGHYNLLGGLVKGRFRFKLTLGEKCELQNASPLGGIKMIANVTPKDHANEVDVFAAPQATFNMAVNKPIIIPEDSGDKAYKVILEKFVVQDENANVIEGNIEWSESKDRATFFSTDILPPDTKLKAIVELSFQEKKNGVFQTIIVDGKKATEVEERNFTTGGAPEYIPLTNIQYCYPVVDQKFMYPKEYPTGYIQLKRGQDYLFDDAQWKSDIIITDELGNIDYSQMNYSSSENKVSYKLPELSNETAYAFKISSTPKNTAGLVSSEEKETNVTQLESDNTFELTQKKADEVSKEGSIDRLDYQFTTSEHDTFSKKMRSISVDNNLWGKIRTKIIYLSSKLEEYEGFDLIELQGSNYTENLPLVHTQATLEDSYFKNQINPILYSQYNISSNFRINRDESEYGYIPKKAIYKSTAYLTYLQNNSGLSFTRTRFPFTYNLTEIYNEDYIGVFYKVNNAFSDGLISLKDSNSIILNTTFPFMSFGDYEIELKYKLPGGIDGGVSKYKFKNMIE